MFKQTVVSVYLLAAIASASTLDVRQIVEQADAAMIGDKVYSVSQMTVYRSDSPQVPMKIESYMDGNRSLTVYRSPARMKGTAYLLIEDDLWVRFSSTNRIRKLSSSARKNSAGGSDFSYNDLAFEDEDISADYDAELTRTGVSVEGISCFEIQFTPRQGADTPYEKAVAFISQTELNYVKIDFYDQGANTKSLDLGDYRVVDGRLYPFQMVMVSHVKPTRTVIVVEEVEFSSSRIEARMFSQAYLQEIR